MAEIEEITDPLHGLTMETIRDPKTDQFEVLINLLHRLPKDVKPELCLTLLEITWHHVTSNNLEKSLIPFRPEFHRQFSSKSNAISSNSKGYSSSSIRNLDGNWRPKPSSSPEKLSSEPPPLPTYQKNIFQRQSSNYLDTRKEISDKVNPDCNVSSTADFETNSFKRLQTSPVITSTTTEEAPFSRQKVQIVKQNSMAVDSYNQSEQTVFEANSGTKQKFDMPRSNVHQQTSFNIPKAVSYAESVKLDPEKVCPSQIRPATHGVFRIPEYDEIDLHEMNNEGEMSPVVVTPKLNPGSSQRPLRRHQIPSDVPYFDNPTSEMIEEANAFDWTAETEGCKESYESQLAIRIARGEKLTDEQIAAYQRDTNLQIQKMNEERTIRQELTADYERMKLQSSTGSGALRVAKVSPSESNVEESMLLSHKIFCHLCSTSDHSTVDCPETPPTKLMRIHNRNLCIKCLSPAHLVADCNVANIVCSTCGMDHLDYIYHKPLGWMLTEHKASSSPFSTASNVTVTNTGGGNSVPRSQQPTLLEDMLDLLGQSNSSSTQQPQKPSDNSSQLLIDFS